jgi:lambda family phage portal protein
MIEILNGESPLFDSPPRRGRRSQNAKASPSRRRSGSSGQAKTKIQKPESASTLQVRNSYEAAGQGRRLSVWRTSSLGPNSAIIRDLETLRARSRDAVRNNSWIKKGVNSWVSNEIGTGIEPRSLAPDENFRTEAKTLWDKWVEVADADGLLNFYGLLSLCSRTRTDAGEIFIRKRVRPLNFGLPVPLQYQLLEPEFCPVRNDQALGGGRFVRAGIEFDGIGRRRAYWMYQSHPGDGLLESFNNQLVPVPAQSIIHHFAPIRAGQIRGVPWTVQSLIKAHDFDEYDDATLSSAKNRSSFSGAITQPNFGDEDFKFSPLTGEPIEKDAHGVPVVNFEAGQFAQLLPGEDIKLFGAETPGGEGYADYVRQQLLGVAAGLDVPYEFLTGDMSKVNDRLVRVILNEFHRTIEQTQWHIVIPQICAPVWIDFLDLAVLSGALKAPADYAERRDEYLKVDWRTDRFDYIHPLQDVQAERLAVRSGFKSRESVVAELGENVEDVDAQNKADKGRAEELGLTYETDVKDAVDAANNPAGD